MDLSKLSDADLEALTNNDLSKVSDEGLAILSGETPAQSEDKGVLDYLKSGASTALDLGLRGLDYAGGATRTTAAGLASLPYYAATGKSLVNTDDLINTIKGQAPDTDTYLDRAGVPKGAEFNLMPEIKIPWTDVKLGEGKSSVRGAAGFVGDVLLDPLTYMSLGTNQAIKQGVKSGLKETIEESGEQVARKTLKDRVKSLADVNLLGKKTAQKGRDLYDSAFRRELAPIYKKTGEVPVEAIDDMFERGVKGTRKTIEKANRNRTEELLKDRALGLGQADKVMVNLDEATEGAYKKINQAVTEKRITPEQAQSTFNWLDSLRGKSKLDDAEMARLTNIINSTDEAIVSGKQNLNELDKSLSGQLDGTQKLINEKKAELNKYQYYKPDYLPPDDPINIKRSQLFDADAELLKKVDNLERDIRLAEGKLGDWEKANLNKMNAGRLDYVSNAEGVAKRTELEKQYEKLIAEVDKARKAYDTQAEKAMKTLDSKQAAVTGAQKKKVRNLQDDLLNLEIRQEDEILKAQKQLDDASTSLSSQKAKRAQAYDDRGRMINQSQQVPELTLKEATNTKTNLYNLLPPTAYDDVGRRLQSFDIAQKDVARGLKEQIIKQGDAYKPGFGQDINEINQKLGGYMQMKRPLRNEASKDMFRDGVTQVKAGAAVVNPWAATGMYLGQLMNATPFRTYAGRGLYNVGTSGIVDPVARRIMIDANRDEQLYNPWQFQK